MSEDQKTRREWELRFPGLNDEWTHWWIDGDGALLAVVSGADLRAALEVVARHHEQCLSIHAYGAKVDSFGEVVRNEKRRYGITDNTAAPALEIAAISEGQCCFCGRALVNKPETIALVQRASDGGGQSLRCHDECLRSLLQRAV